MIYNNVNTIVGSIMDSFLDNGMICVDATVGNGGDTLKILNNISPDGFVFGFDIQRKAIENTKERLSKHSFNNFKLILDGHENIENYLDFSIDFAVFNLGYLPKYDHSITTKANTTIKSLDYLMSILKKNGKILISAYKGHKGGMEEYTALKKWLESVDQKKFNVCEMEFINQVNYPPSLFVVEKR